MFEIRHNGKSIRPDEELADLLQKDITEKAMAAIEERVHNVASSIVAPETGKQSDVFVRRTGDTSLNLQTNGSPEFAREIERRCLATATISHSIRIAARLNQSPLSEVLRSCLGANPMTEQQNRRTAAFSAL